MLLKLSFPAGIYLLKVNNRNNRTRCDTTRTTLITSRSGSVFNVNFTHVSDLVLVVSIVNFEHVIAGWVEHFFATWTHFSWSSIDLTTFSALQFQHLCYVYCRNNQSKPYLKKAHFKVENPMKMSVMDFNFNEAVTLEQMDCVGRFPWSFQNIQKRLHKRTLEAVVLFCYRSMPSFPIRFHTVYSYLSLLPFFMHDINYQLASWWALSQSSVILYLLDCWWWKRMANQPSKCKRPVLL